jgi:CBS domain containing-hemolysin-like protein
MYFINELVIILVMIILNAVFAAYEMALASISRIKLMYLVETRKKGATEALFMKDRMEASLAAVQLGVTFVGSIAAAVGGAGPLKPYPLFPEDPWPLQGHGRIFEFGRAGHPFKLIYHHIR